MPPKGARKTAADWKTTKPNGRIEWGQQLVAELASEVNSGLPDAVDSEDIVSVSEVTLMRYSNSRNLPMMWRSHRLWNAKSLTSPLWIRPMPDPSSTFQSRSAWCYDFMYCELRSHAKASLKRDARHRQEDARVRK